ncbi:MAG TPA: NifU family protein [Myxococcota bacterium]|nr:NifU family protein [Myxococcota bacterium]
MPPSLGDGSREINATSAKGLRPESVRKALDVVRPGLVADGGNAELLSVGEDGLVRLELQGACARCPAREMTRRLVLEPALKARVPGVTAVLV